MRYRIKVKKQWVNSGYATFTVQAKYKYLPFWLSVSDKFEKSAQAEDYIERMLEEFPHD